MEPTAPDEQAALPRFLENAEGRLRGRRSVPSGLVVHELDPEHQAATAHVPDGAVSALEGLEALLQYAPCVAELSTSPSSTTTSIVALAAAHEIGFPPNVEMLPPAHPLAMGVVVTTALIG